MSKLELLYSQIFLKLTKESLDCGFIRERDAEDKKRKTNCSYNMKFSNVQLFT